LEEVKLNNCILTPGRHVGSEAKEVDGIPFEKKLTGLVQKLSAQFAISAELEKVISKNLKNLGY